MAHHGGHGYPKTKQIKERLQREAAERQTAYDTLSLKQKLEKLPPEPLCARQRTKLLVAISAQETKNQEKKK